MGNQNPKYLKVFFLLFGFYVLSSFVRILFYIE